MRTQAFLSIKLIIKEQLNDMKCDFFDILNIFKTL